MDHGILNIPGRTNGINAELDRWKVNQAKAAKAERTARAATHKTLKARAKALWAEIGEAMVAVHGPKFGVTKLRTHLTSMAKWEPSKFIRLAEKFQSEQ